MEIEKPAEGILGHAYIPIAISISGKALYAWIPYARTKI
jgi:hypothetical protein